MPLCRCGTSVFKASVVRTSKQMCGIFGAVSLTHGTRINSSQVKRLGDALEHRGPDDRGILETEKAVLGATRLAILDLSERGHMPFSTPDGRYALAYNGEIYNFQELRHDLERV